MSLPTKRRKSKNIGYENHEPINKEFVETSKYFSFLTCQRVKTNNVKLNTLTIPNSFLLKMIYKCF